MIKIAKFKEVSQGTSFRSQWSVDKMKILGFWIKHVVISSVSHSSNAASKLFPSMARVLCSVLVTVS